MIERILFVPILILAIVVHETSHGMAALKAGDPTAKMMGRITLNPIPHIDLFGSIIVPGILLLSGTPFLFGWAKPVPINPSYFRNPREDEIRVSFAGPGSNLLLSLAFLVLTIFVVVLFNISNFSSRSLETMYVVLRSGMIINLVLAFFNLIPIPPLDGSHILENILPYRYAQYIDKIKPYGFILLLLFIMTPLINVAFFPVRVIYNFYTQILQLFM